MLASALPAPRRLLSALLLLPLLWWAGWAAAADLQPVPPLKAPVTDLAQLLSPAEAEALNRKLLDLDREKGSQVAVLIVPTTQPETIFDYSFRVADHWKLGRKGVDDGVLLVLAVKDRRSHLQVGYGLEGAIPDIRAKQILDDIMRPYFQQGQFAAGLDAGTDAVIRLINGEGLPAAAPRAQGQRRGNDSPFMMAVMAGLFGGMFLRAIFGRLLGGLAAGGIAGAVALMLGIATAGAVFIGVLALLGVLVFGFGHLGGLGGLGGGRSGGFGGGGFGGGGGGFGGGGASGSW